MSRLPTRPSLLDRALRVLGEACDRHVWLPLAIALVLLSLVNLIH